MYLKTQRLASALGALLASTLTIVACGGGGGGKVPPAATAAASKSAGGSGAAAKLTLTASNILFDRTEPKASPGDLTIELDNKDAGVPHNVEVFTGKDATGESVGLTAIESGPVRQTLMVTLATGDYYYQCDVHPTTMSGKLDVE